MNALELKKDIIEKISCIDDTRFLMAIQTIVSKSSKSIYLELDDDLLNELTLTKEDVNHGNYKTQEDLDKKLDAWLNV